jgi:hypothetical protein
MGDYGASSYGASEYSAFDNTGDDYRQGIVGGGEMEETPGYDSQFNDGALRASLSTSTRARPDMWPKSASEMAQHVHCPAQAMNEDADTEHTRWAARSSGPPPGRNGWVFMPHSKKWVRA